MSTIPLISGATNVIKITPNSSLIPASFSGIDNLFNFSNLSDSKFSNWKTIATSDEKIGVVDGSSGNETHRYIDPDYNISSPEGSLWLLGDAEEDHSFYIQTGSNLSKSNSSSTFPDHFNSYGFTESSGNFEDRCGLRNGTPINSITYDRDCVIGKGVRFNGTASRSRLNTMPYLSGLSNLSILLLTKTPGDVLLFQRAVMTLQFLSAGGFFACQFSADNLTLVPAGDIPTDSFYLASAVFDGTLDPDERNKFYVNKVRSTPMVSNNTGTLTDVNNVNYGDIGPITGATNNMEIDEARFINRSLSSDEIALRYNQWFDQSNYWTVTVQPVVTSVLKNGDGTFNVRGSGFKPESTNPTGTINGVPFSIQGTVTDNFFVVRSETGTPIDASQLTVINSDGEQDTGIIGEVPPTIDEKASPVYLSTVGGTRLINTKYGNPLGNVVDNSAGENPVEENIKNTNRSGGGGSNLSMYSKPSWLYR